MEVGSSQTSKACSSMDLHLDILSEEQDEQRQARIISLTHYYKQNGDLVPDPDMEIRVYSRDKMAEALTFQNLFIYQEVYPTSTTINICLRTQLNSLLKYWLNNCIQDGHQFY